MQVVLAALYLPCGAGAAGFAKGKAAKRMGRGKSFYAKRIAPHPLSIV